MHSMLCMSMQLMQIAMIILTHTCICETCELLPPFWYSSTFLTMYLLYFSHQCSWYKRTQEHKKNAFFSQKACWCSQYKQNHIQYMKGCYSGFILSSEVCLSLFQRVKRKEATNQSIKSKWVLIWICRLNSNYRASQGRIQESP